MIIVRIFVIFYLIFVSFIFYLILSYLVCTSNFNFYLTHKLSSIFIIITTNFREHAESE